MGFVFVTQWQVQDQIEATAQAELVQLLGQSGGHIQWLVGEVVGVSHRQRL
jgi:hypothetical protein